MVELRKLAFGSLSFVLALAAVGAPAQATRPVAAEPSSPAATPASQKVLAEPEAAAQHEAVAAAATARRTGKRVELASATTESRQVFVNPDGRRALHQSVAPVRVRRGTGWAPVDTNLHFAA